MDGQQTSSFLFFIAEELLALWPFILVPAALLALIRPAGRLTFFILGVLWFFGTGLLPYSGGPHNPLLLLPFVGLCVAVAAVLAELVVRLGRLVRRTLRARSPSEGPD